MLRFLNKVWKSGLYHTFMEKLVMIVLEGFTWTVNFESLMMCQAMQSLCSRCPYIYLGDGSSFLPFKNKKTTEAHRSEMSCSKPRSQ